MGSRALLKRHSSVHTGRKDFACEFDECPYTSSHKSNLERHVIRKHVGGGGNKSDSATSGEDEAKEAPQAVVATGRQIGSSEMWASRIRLCHQLYKCESCKMQF